MSRFKRFIETDVVTEAVKRIHHIYDLHDTVVVSFSGGKDSQVVLELTHQVAQERGLDKVKVVFHDEELIPQTAIDSVEKYRAMPWVDMLYLAVPLASRKFILGKTTPYIQWDPSRQWVRPKPEHAYVLEEGDPRVLDQHDLDGLIADYFSSKGKVCIMLGLRTEESVFRYRAMTNRLHDNYIVGRQGRVTGASPIYDWLENDVFRFFYDRGLTYAKTYDDQLWAGDTLRVSTPLHPQRAKRLEMVKRGDPLFYDSLLAVFPEIEVQQRYWAEYNADSTELVEEYGQSLSGVRRYIMENIEGDDRVKALRLLTIVEPRIKATPEAWPLDHVLRTFSSGSYHKGLFPRYQPKAETA